MSKYYITGNVQILSSPSQDRVGGYDSDPIYETRYNSETSRPFCYYIDNIDNYGDAFHSVKNKINNQTGYDETIGNFWNVRIISEDMFFDDIDYYYFTG